MDAAGFIWSFVFGVIGLSYFIYGKKAVHITARLSGPFLMMFPYFVSNTWVMVGVGAGLMALPFVYRV